MNKTDLIEMQIHEATDIYYLQPNDAITRMCIRDAINRNVACSYVIERTAPNLVDNNEVHGIINMGTVEYKFVIKPGLSLMDGSIVEVEEIVK